MHQNAFRLVSAFSIFVSIAASATDASATTVLSDGNFTNVTAMPGFSNPGVTLTGLSVCASCGNGGGAGLQASYTWTGTGGSIDFFIDNALSYNPSSQGAISNLTMSIDKQITLNMSTNASNTGNNALFVPIIVQDGKIYFATLVSGPHIFTTPGTSNYDTLSASIVAAQFLQFDPVQISVPGQPNFAGGTMLFGVAASTPVGVTGPPGLAETINFDNLAVRINDVPLPAALPLFATGLGVLALLGWRRKRTTARMISLPTVLGVVSCVILTAATSASYASTITLRTNDATVVAAFGEAGQGWWNNTDPAVDTNTNYAAGVGFRDFLTFDLNNPLLTGQTIVGATLRLQAFGSQQTGTLRFFDVTSNPVAVNNNVGTNATIWSDLGSGTVYGSLTITTTPSSADILSIPLNAAAIAALNAGIGAGFFVFGGDYDSGFLFFGSFDNGNQQLVLEVIPIPAALPLFATGLGALGLLGWRRKRKQAA